MSDKFLGKQLINILYIISEAVKKKTKKDPLRGYFFKKTLQQIFQKADPLRSEATAPTKPASEKFLSEKK